MLFGQASIHSNVVGLAFVLRLLRLSLTAYEHVNEREPGREGGSDGEREREREGGMELSLIHI